MLLQSENVSDNVSSLCATFITSVVDKKLVFCELTETVDVQAPVVRIAFDLLESLIVVELRFNLVDGYLDF